MLQWNGIHAYENFANFDYLRQIVLFKADLRSPGVPEDAESKKMAGNVSSTAVLVCIPGKVSLVSGSS